MGQREWLLDMKKPVEIFCDGSYAKYKGEKIGGYSTIMLFGDKIKENASRSYKETTILRMEMKAIISGLESVKPGFDIYIYSDSKIVIDSINKWLPKWNKEGKLNRRINNDLWRRFNAIKNKHTRGNSYMSFCWIRSHTGHKYNEMADKLASVARKKKNPVKCKVNN